jgi:hypothetical protein
MARHEQLAQEVMKQPRECPWILNCLREPARLTRRETGDRLRIDDEDQVSLLVKKKMLRPLGHHQGRRQLWFFADEVEEHAHDRRWMDKMTAILQEGEPPGAEEAK